MTTDLHEVDLEVSKAEKISQFDGRVKSLFGLYCILDVQANICGPLFDVENDLIACRAFVSTLANMPKHIRSDYSLIRVGCVERDGQTCLVAPEKGNNIIVANGLDYSDLAEDIIKNRMEVNHGNEKSGSTAL